jgi:LAO/AO transport system kinase
MSSDLTDNLLSGDPRSVARAISVVEHGGPRAAELMRAVFPNTGNATVIGITGAPGAGKSSLVDKLALFYKKKGEKVGIVCIDPSSPFSGGAILGDRIRMSTLGLDKNIFIRSMATRGNLGGLSRATVDAVAILDAAGYDKVIVETVGVGQDEVEIVKTADVSVVVLVPGMGDDIQAIKAGIMEIGDVFVINKADREGVLRTQKELEALLTLAHRPDMWHPPIVKTIATENKGIEDLADALDKYVGYSATELGEEIAGRKSSIAKWRLLELLRERLLSDLLSRNGADAQLERLAADVAAKRIDPYSAVEKILTEPPAQAGRQNLNT